MIATVNSFTSQKFKFWAFASMVLLVFVHGYNLQDRYMQPWTMPGEPMTLTSFTEYFLANGIFRFRIPMLFIISGYLFALQDHQPYKQRIRKRVRTLLWPYLIWSAIAILFTYVLEFSATGSSLVASSHICQIDDKRALLHEYHWYEVLARWIFFPVAYQLWFIRVLLIYNIAYPAIRYCVTHRIAKWLFFPIAILLFISTFGAILIEGEGLLFFALGVWMQKRSFNIEQPGRWLNPLGWGILFVILCIVKTWLSFNGLALMGDAVYIVMALMHKLAVVSGLIAAWYGCNVLVKYCMNLQWFVWASAFSFMIYAMHTPFVAYAIDGVFILINHLPGYRMITFILLPLSVIVVCIGIGALLRSLWPKGYAVLTGGRGF